ncbi:hypothetical protein U1Q18_048136 [Sarracenia purpurea var. burkii]
MHEGHKETRLGREQDWEGSAVGLRPGSKLETEIEPDEKLSNGLGEENPLSWQEDVDGHRAEGEPGADMQRRLACILCQLPSLTINHVFLLMRWRCKLFGGGRKGCMEFLDKEEDG